LNRLIADFETRFAVYLKNDLLINAALLDLRHAEQMDKLFEKSFASFIPPPIDFAKQSKFGNVEISVNVESIADNEIQVSLYEGNFQNMPSNPSEMIEHNRQDNILELGLTYFRHAVKNNQIKPINDFAPWLCYQSNRAS